LQERLGLTYLLISHDLAVVRHMSDQVGVMYLGRLVEVRPTREIFADPRHPYTQMLLDAVPDLTMDVPRKTMVAGEVPSPINPPSGCTYHPRCPLAADLCRKVAPQLINNVACHADAGKLATDD
jgi:peptide/nickel transport system ATP-binding protein